MYWRCGKQYEYRYVLGIKSPPGVALEEGSCHHDTLCNNNTHKIKTGKDRSVKYLVQRFCDDFNDRAKGIPRSEWRLAETTKDKVIKRGKLIQTQYHKQFTPYLNPEFCEREVRFKVGEVEVLGYIDVVGLCGFQLRTPIRGVFDYKISTRLKSDDELKGSVALSHYGWGAVDLLNCNWKNPPHVGYCILKKTGDSRPLFQHTLLTAQRIKWYRQQVLSVANAISLGSFPVRNAAGWECCEKYCGYWKRCRGKVWKG
jgi:hypothetical protein